MSTSKHLALLAVNAYKVTNEDVYKKRQTYKTNPFSHFLPYTINTNKDCSNRLIDSSAFLQYMGIVENDNGFDEHILFDMMTFDDLLHEEISNSDYYGLFEHIDFMKIFDKVDVKMYKDVHNKLGAPIYLIVEMIYTGSYDHYSGATEYDLFVDIIGYLDENCNKQLFDK